MTTSQPSDKSVSCVFYHEDSHRQATRRACRLIQRNPQSEPWHYGLCRTCPVPGLLRANPCIHLVLEARVVRKLGIFQRVEPYTVCTAKAVELTNPDACWRGCDLFQLPSAAPGNFISIDALMAAEDASSAE